MTTVQQRIVKELVKRYKDDPQVVGLRVIGSVGRREERPNSDVDFEVVRADRENWTWQGFKKHSVHIDLVISSPKHLLYQFKHYPYLCYIELDKKILYDPTGFLKKLTKDIRDYMNQHPKVLAFWNREFQLMKQAKSLGITQKGLIELFDQAEILFSAKHRITRTYFRSTPKNNPGSI